MSAIEAEIGRALLRITDQGLSRNEAYELIGLSRAYGRRFYRLAEAPENRLLGHFSTDNAGPAGTGTPRADLGLNGTNPDAKAERKP